MYLSIVKYLDQLRRAEGEVSVEEAAVDYAAQFKQHPIKKILGGLLAAIVSGEGAPTRADVPAPAVDQNLNTGSE